ncbi:DUF1801 domain-containing protein [Aequorivita sp. SDUM287046]|uniref:DUF1801 domain-containing protein n=1 Tax=Aequorivita aurantiaca TaxID=3053356 RepID=A0ABT8DLX9_9FLAO|nr:DUF1801 domain-containing protein [Aequorivita aurantiaca]MDN3724238.1 DUF1801 domain-containing protein [Aequorivita aurantiaca]
MKGEKLENIDAYISTFSEEIQLILTSIRKRINSIAPKAEESMSYGMPAFKLNGKPLIYFGGYKNHIGFYALPSGNVAFKKELANYKTGKGSIQFPLEKPMPWKLIEKIVKFRMEEIQSKN